MATASKRSIQAAFYAQIMFRDGNGYPMGQLTDPDNPVADTTTSAYVVRGLMSYTAPQLTQPVVTNFGDQQVISKTRHAATDYGRTLLEFSQEDDTFESYVKNMSIDVTTDTEWVIKSRNAGQDDFKPFMVLLNIETTDELTGKTKWKNVAILNTDITQDIEAGAGQITGDATNPNPLTWGVDGSLSCRDITGLLISALNTAVANDRDDTTYFYTDNPLSVTTYIADGVETTFDLPLEPVSSDATGAAQNHFTLNGTQTAVTSVSTTSPFTVTLTAAGASGDIGVMVYETAKLGAAC